MGDGGWGDGKWGNGEMGRWGDGEMGRWGMEGKRVIIVTNKQRNLREK